MKFHEKAVVEHLINLANKIESGEYGVERIETEVSFRDVASKGMMLRTPTSGRTLHLAYYIKGGNQ